MEFAQVAFSVAHASARGCAKAQSERRVVELTALVGYYTMVAMTLNAHEIPLPDGVQPAFPLPQHVDLT